MLGVNKLKMYPCLQYLIVLIIISLNASCTTEKVDNSECMENNFFVDNLVPLSKSIVPSLEGKSKGENGKIGIIGGSTEYTGAPYFAALTALKTGADLVYVITTAGAAPVIKSYSPDLIVYPFLHISTASKINSLIPKMDVIVIGPGLGRENEALQLTYEIIQTCRSLGKPLVIDADGLYAISKNHSIIRDYPKPGAILTPNQRESKKLLESIPSNINNQNYWGNYVSILTKGDKDQFNSSVTCYNWALSFGGSGRRAGGQGDILSGALGTLYNWALKSNLVNEHQTQLSQSVAAYSAAKFTRKCNYIAYSLYGRSMTASDMLKEIHPAFEGTFS